VLQCNIIIYSTCVKLFVCPALYKKHKTCYDGTLPVLKPSHIYIVFGLKMI